MSPDVIVIGAGANGLVAAHALARAGRRVTVLERRGAPTAEPDVGWVPPAVIRELRLEQDGLRIERPDPWIAAPLGDGERLELWRNPARSAEAIRRLSPSDANRWPSFCDRLRRVTEILEYIYQRPAPAVATGEAAALWNLAQLGLRARRLGTKGMVDLLRIPPMAIAEVLDDWFESDVLKGVLAAAGVLHLRQGPQSGGTAFLFLHHHVGSPAGVYRPPRSNLADVLAARSGVDLRHGAAVSKIDLRDGRAVGVTLASGEQIAASVVVSGLDPRRTMLDLVEPGWLEPEMTRAFMNVKCRGTAARVTLAMTGAPLTTTLAVTPSLAYLERAYDDVKYGRASERPWLEAQPAGQAPDGRQRVVLHVQYAPYLPEDGPWDDARRHALGARALAALAEREPAFRDAAVVEVLTPSDLEARDGATEGQAYHGELTLDQVLFMRPVPGWSRYRTPVSGLYLCGPGTHPGGAIAGGPGLLAARAIVVGGRL